MKRIISLFALLAVIASCGLSNAAIAEEEAASPARLLVEKKILNKYLVEARDIIVHYQIFNVGGSAAIDVSINDVSLPEDHFEIVGGSSKFTIPRLAPGSNTTHTVVFRPKVGVWGRFNFTSGDVAYLPTEDAKDAQVAYTSEPGEGFIVSDKEFERKFSPHLLDWAAFGVMTLPSLLFPYLLWNKSRSKYEAIARASSKRQ
jgi:translocon-associated protein subunit beta